MPEDVMLREAMEAVRQGQPRRALDLLTRLLRADQSNPVYWLWMSAVVATSKEQIYCLQTVLRFDPANRAAQQGLLVIGAVQPDDNVVPRPPMRRKWQVEEITEPPTGAKANLKKPAVRVGLFILSGVVVLGLIAVGIFGYNRKPSAVALRPTKTPGPAPTFTITPSPQGGIPTPKISPSPTYQGPKPLWMFLEATYTPTPLYVNTPHPISEAFRAGQRALERRNIVTALTFFKQANQIDSSAPDIPFYIGEVYRTMADYPAALEAYNQSLELNPAFAPTYLGRARTHLAIDPAADVLPDLQAAIERDPNLGEAHLEMAAFYLERKDLAAALPALEAAEALLPESPLVMVYKAHLRLLEGNNSEALALAAEAKERDLTLLRAYYVLGLAALANGQHQQAIAALETFLDYETDHSVGWLALAQAPDVILMDVSMPRMGGVEATRQIKREFPHIGIVALTMYEEQQYIFDLVRAGATGYLLKDSESAQIIAAIRAISRGESLIQPSVASKILAEFSLMAQKKGKKSAWAEHDLAEREITVLRLVADGKTNKEIANSLELSEKTVKNHVRNIFHKLQVYDRTQPAILAIRKGLIELDPRP